MIRRDKGDKGDKDDKGGIREMKMIKVKSEKIQSGFMEIQRKSMMNSIEKSRRR